MEAIIDQTISEISALMKDERIHYTDIERTSDTTFTAYDAPDQCRSESRISLSEVVPLFGPGVSIGSTLAGCVRVTGTAMKNG